MLSGISAANAFEIELPSVGLTNVPLEIVITGVNPGDVVTATIEGESFWARGDAKGRAVITDVRIENIGEANIIATANEQTLSSRLRILPGWVSVLPAFLAIVVGLIIRNVLAALLLGLWLGATLLESISPLGILRGLLDTFAVFIANALADADHAAIILFTMMIGGMVGIITRNGGMASIVKLVVSRARSAVGGQVSVWFMGLIIFFDDYANTLVVGNTARPITDHLQISREKLAYIVDSTAAPVVCLAFITTWIGYEVSLIDEAIKGIDQLAATPAYAIFINSILYSFYPILAVLFVFIVSSSGRDFGPMLKAELRARAGQVESQANGEQPAISGETLAAKQNIPMRAANAYLPIFTLIIALALSLYITGEGDSITEIVGSADPYIAMMWASFVGALMAAGLSVGQRLLSAHEAVDAWYGGARATLFGMIILVLAWSMADITNALNAKGFLISVLGDALPVAIVPAIVFLLAAVTAFATGTSWGTMGILMPLVIPLAWAVMSVNGMTNPDGMHILYSSVACTLAGAVWGDHCSPISDTTVLSSIASGCDHIEHVRTQMPYALLVGVVALFVGTLPAGYGLPPWLLIAVGLVILVLILRGIGRRADSVAA